MKIQINTDSHIAGSETLAAQVEQKINHTLKRFSERITSVQVHLSDINSSKAGAADKRCVIEVRVANLNPVTVSHQAPKVALAVDGAREKMANALDAAVGKRDTITHEQITPSDDADLV